MSPLQTFSIILGPRYVALWSCLLSSRAIAAPPTDIVPNTPNCTTVNTTQGSAFLKNLQDVLAYLSENTPETKSSSYASGSHPDIVYGLSECYNMTQSDCGQCFNIITDDFRATCPLAVGAQMYVNYTHYRCYVRYENYNFVGPNITLPPPAAPPKAVPPNNRKGTLVLLCFRLLLSQCTGRKSTKSKIILGTVMPLVALFFAALGVYFKLCKPSKRQGNSQTYGDDIQENLRITRAYRYEELRVATEDFAEHNKLGQGGFGAVYKGVLRDGRQVAVKKLVVPFHTGNDGFVNEVNVISSIRHRNLVKLEGYCLEGQQKMLVLDYVVNGNLGDALFGRNIELDWPSRYTIILGIARGLAYLHEESHIQIIHRDIKACNILLDNRLEPKISDFGISKLFDRDRVSTTGSRVAGTYGYLAPEYAMGGRLTAKVDVFSYGVLVLEIVSGRRVSNPSLAEDQEQLLEWAWKLNSDGILETLIDPHLKLTTSSASHDAWKVQALKVLNIALLCTQLDDASRPTMSQVVAMLLEYLAVPAIPSRKPTYSSILPRLRERMGEQSSSTTGLGSSITSSTTGTRSTAGRLLVNSQSYGSFGPR